ncbi:hypothetical protein D3C81_1675310 [compost metagenome]
MGLVQRNGGKTGLRPQTFLHNIIGGKEKKIGIPRGIRSALQRIGLHGNHCQTVPLFYPFPEAVADHLLPYFRLLQLALVQLHQKKHLELPGIP